jgi:hypothetical protein
MFFSFVGGRQWKATEVEEEIGAVASLGFNQRYLQFISIIV